MTSPRTALLTDLVATIAANGAWLVSAAGRIVAGTNEPRGELEARISARGRRTQAGDDPAPDEAWSLAAERVTPDLTLVVAVGTAGTVGPTQAAMRLAASALAGTQAEENPPPALTDWLDDQPGARSVFAVSVDELDALGEAFGAQVADAFLDAVAERIDAWAGRSARTAGVTLARTLPMHLAARTDLPDIESARLEAETLRAVLAEPTAIAAGPPGSPSLISRSVTVGVAVDRLGTAAAAELVTSAQRALGAGRAGGGDQVAVFVADKARRRHDRLRLELELEDAAHGEQLRLHYQPEYDLRTGQIVAVEALVRWQHPRLGLLSADRFVPGTEHTHAFTAVQRWVIEQTCEQLARWRHTGLAADLALRINAAAAQVLSGSITEALLSARDRHGLLDADVCVELTERMLPADPDSVRRLAAVIDEWHEHSIRVAVDDFGIGQGTLTHLLDLPIDILKLDQSYVRRVAVDPHAYAIVAHMVQLATDLGIAGVVAEGVDSTATIDTLLALGVTHAQGNFLSPARSSTTIAELLKPVQARKSGHRLGSIPSGRNGVVSSGSGVLGPS